jgi:hypothetical protein
MSVSDKAVIAVAITFEIFMLKTRYQTAGCRTQQECPTHTIFRVSGAFSRMLTATAQ